MTNWLELNFDYFVMLYGIAVLIAGYAFTTLQRTSPGAPAWRCLAFFMLLRCAQIYVSIIDSSNFEMPSLSTISNAILFTTGLSLLEFSRLSFSKLELHFHSRIVYPIAVVTSLLIGVITNQYFASSIAGMGITGGVFALLAILKSAHLYAETQKKYIRAIGYLVALTTVVYISGGFHKDYAAALLLIDSDPNIYLITAFLLVRLIAVLIIIYLVLSIVHGRIPFRFSTIGIHRGLAIGAVAFIIFFGGFFAEHDGDHSQREIDRLHKSISHEIASTINTDYVRRFTFTPLDTTNAEFNRIELQLTEISQWAQISDIYTYRVVGNSIQYGPKSRNLVAWHRFPMHHNTRAFVAI